MNNQETIQKYPIVDPPNVEPPKSAPGKSNGVEAKKISFTPQQIAKIIDDARKAVYGRNAYPPPGSLLNN